MQAPDAEEEGKQADDMIRSEEIKGSITDAKEEEKQADCDDEMIGH